LRCWHSLRSRQTSIPLKPSGSGSSLDYPTTRHRRRASMSFGGVPRMFGTVLPKTNASGWSKACQRVFLLWFLPRVAILSFDFFIDTCFCYDSK